MAKKPLEFPTPERRRRVRIAGVLYLALGLLFLMAYAYSEDGFWLFGAAIGVLVGFGLLGYRQKVTVNGATGRITHCRGFLVDLHRRSYSWDYFRQVEVREKVTQTTRFSRIAGRTWEPGLEVRYAVVLANGETLEVDATGDLDLARRWADAVGAELGIPVAPEVRRVAERPAVESGTGGLPVWARWLLILLLLGALLGWIGFNLYQAEKHMRSEQEEYSRSE